MVIWCNLCSCLALRMVVRCGEHMCWLFLWRTCTPMADVHERIKQQVFAECSCSAAGTTLSKNRCFKSLWFDNLTTEMKSLRFENHSLSSPGHILPVSKWVGDPALKRTRSQGATWKMSCVHFATWDVQKTQLTEQAKFKSSKWHSTAPNKKATSPDIGQLSHVEIGRLFGVP